MGYLGQRSLGSAVSCCSNRAGVGLPGYHAGDEKVRWTFFSCLRIYF